MSFKTKHSSNIEGSLDAKTVNDEFSHGYCIPTDGHAPSEEQPRGGPTR